MPHFPRLVPCFPRLAGIATAAAVALAALVASPTSAHEPTVTDPHVVEHFDFAAGQTPENIALEPDGSANVTFALARQVARLAPNAEPRTLAEFPFVANPATPRVGAALTTGIARAHDGTLYVNYATGTKLTGIWRLRPGSHTPKQIACLPKNGFPNGLALDERHGTIYATDSALGTVWRVPTHVAPRRGCVKPKAWATGSKLQPPAQPTGQFGANGLKVHRGAVWVSNIDRGLLLRIPVNPNGSAGPIQTRATGLRGIDDFTFTDHRDDTLLAALIYDSKVALVRPDGRHKTVLTSQDGLSNPTAVALHGKTVYVTSASFFTTENPDPNLLLARLNRHHH